VLETTEALPFDGFVGAFKQRTIEALQQQQGLAIDFAYGNATTDICAYAGASIPTTSTFIIGPNGGQGCDGGAPTQAIKSYPEHLVDLPAILNF
jgi:phosphatidate phosphatase PAH1